MKINKELIKDMEIINVDLKDYGIINLIQED